MFQFTWSEIVILKCTWKSLRSFCHSINPVFSIFLQILKKKKKKILSLRDDGAKRTEWNTCYKRVTSASRCLSTEENGNAIRTEIMLVIVTNHLKTCPVHFSLLWFHLHCGLYMPHKDTMIAMCCIQATLSRPSFSGSCLFLLDVRFPSPLFQHGQQHVKNPEPVSWKVFTHPI